MSLTIDLSPDQEEQLADLAERSGIAPGELAKKLVVQHLTHTLAPSERARREEVMRELVAESERLNLY
jgi:hypothetical protein